MSAEYEALLRERITQLRLQENISEHGMSMELGKSGSYIRSITSGLSLPSVRELFNIIEYFGITPFEFFAGMQLGNDVRTTLHRKIAALSEEDAEKVSLFIDWISR